MTSKADQRITTKILSSHTTDSSTPTMRSKTTRSVSIRRPKRAIQLRISIDRIYPEPRPTTTRRTLLTVQRTSQFWILQSMKRCLYCRTMLSLTAHSHHHPCCHRPRTRYGSQKSRGQIAEAPITTRSAKRRPLAHRMGRIRAMDIRRVSTDMRIDQLHINRRRIEAGRLRRPEAVRGTTTRFASKSTRRSNSNNFLLAINVDRIMNLCIPFLWIPILQVKGICDHSAMIET